MNVTDTLFMKPLLAIAVAVIALTGGAADAATYTLRGGTVATDSTPLGRVGAYFKEIVEKKSKGQIEVKWHPNAQLGGEVAILNQMNDGVIQFATLSTAISSSLNPKLDVMYLPYFLPNAWETYENRFRGSPAESELLGGLSKVGITGLGLIPYGVDALAYKGAPIRTLEEAKGRKLRAAESVNIRTTLESMGLNAVPLPWNEVYPSIQTKVVEGLTTPPFMVKGARLNEVVDNMTLADHLFGVYVFWLREDALAKLPNEMKTLVREAAKEAVERGWRELRALELTSTAELEKVGVKVWRLSDAEKARFMKATLPVVRNFEQRIEKSSGDGRAFMRKMYQATGQDYDKIVGQ